MENQPDVSAFHALTRWFALATISFLSILGGDAFRLALDLAFPSAVLFLTLQIFRLKTLQVVCGIMFIVLLLQLTQFWLRKSIVDAVIFLATTVSVLDAAYNIYMIFRRRMEYQFSSFCTQLS